MNETIEEIIENFSLLDDWETRYSYVIELGGALEPYPQEARDAAHKVPGCVSQVWLLTKQDEQKDPRLEFLADSDSHIVRGLLYIMLALFSGQKASDILATDIEVFLTKLGLDEHLTPQRSNGLRSVIARIYAEARSALDGEGS